MCELKILDVSLTNIKNLNDLDELKKIEYIFLPVHLDSSNLEKKLKYRLIDKQLRGKIITSYCIYFNKIYKSCEGIHTGILQF